MPSDAALDIVDKIFGDQKASAIDATNDAISATTYDMIQAKKLEFAKQMGFDLDDTAQASADEVEKSIDGVGDAEVTDVDTSGVRLPEDPPEDEAPGTPSSVEASAETDEVNQEEEPEDETDS